METEQPMAVETPSSSSEPKSMESSIEAEKQSNSIETPADKEETTPQNTTGKVYEDYFDKISD